MSQPLFRAEALAARERESLGVPTAAAAATSPVRAAATVPLILQSEAAECGLACLAIASGLLGAELDMANLRRKHPVSSQGMTLKEVSDVAAALDMSTRAVRCELDELAQLSAPSILHWGLNHFVVLEAVKGS